MSASQNPSNIAFPSGYSGLQNELWEGFYLKELSISAPKDLYKNSGGRRFTAGVRNVLIDKTGFTASFNIDNLLKYSEGSADGWEFSIDNIQVNVIQNNLESGGFNGKIGLPIQAPTDDDDGDDLGKNHLAYKAKLYYSYGEDGGFGFALNVEVEEDIVIDMPGIASKATINDNSYVYFRTGKTGNDTRPANMPSEFAPENISFRLAGDITISIANAGSASDRFSAPLSFQGVEFVLTYSDDTGFSNDPVLNNIGFASPQKFVGGLEEEDGIGDSGGFPVSISNFEIENQLSTESITATFKFNIALNLADDDDGGFQASADIAIPATYYFSRPSDRFRLGTPEIGQVCIGYGSSSGDDGTEK